MSKAIMDWDEVEEGYIDALDIDGAIKIGGLSYMPSVILKKVDSIAYGIGLSEYADMLSEDYIIEGINDEEDEDD